MNPGHDHQWLTDRIALGSVVSRIEHVHHLLEERITHVLDCRLGTQFDSVYEGTPITVLRCGTADDGRTKPDAWFHSGIQFALDALARRRSRVLIHCLVGASRGPSMAYAVLCAQGMPGNEAVTKILTARPLLRGIKYRKDADRALETWKRR